MKDYMNELLTSLAKNIVVADISVAEAAYNDGDVRKLEKVWDELAELAIKADFAGSDDEVDIYLAGAEQVYNMLEKARKVHQGFDSYFADSLEELEELGLGIFK